jgi:hypothetical protein
MKIELKDTYYGPAEHASILEALYAERIFSIKKTETGFKLTECCDEFFSLDLTREQLLALADEIRDFATEPTTVPQQPASPG